MGLKRFVYGLPAMRVYRDFRTKQLSKRHRDHPLGFRFAGTEAFFDLAWEAEERGCFQEEFARASVFIDVGANQGLYTCLAAARGLRVAAVEPETGNLRFLLSNLLANRFQAEVFPVALADAPGVTQLYGDGDTASLFAGWASANQSFAQLVPTNTMDNLFADRWANEDVFIKVDVEGFELAVLSGAARLLARPNKPRWLIETFPTNFDARQTPNPGFMKLFELMHAAGYQCHRADSREAVTLEQARDWADRRAIKEVGRSNYLFSPL